MSIICYCGRPVPSAPQYRRFGLGTRPYSVLMGPGCLYFLMNIGL